MYEFKAVAFSSEEGLVLQFSFVSIQQASYQLEKDLEGTFCPGCCATPWCLPGCLERPRQVLQSATVSAGTTWNVGQWEKSLLCLLVLKNLQKPSASLLRYRTGWKALLNGLTIM